MDDEVSRAPEVVILTTFQLFALPLVTAWLLLVAVRFRRSTRVLVVGLLAIGLLAIAALVTGQVSAGELGLDLDRSWLSTIGLASVWLLLMLAYSPWADRLATRWVAEPPTLDVFRSLQQSRSKLLIGILVAWFLGGFLEELVFRGIVLQSARIVLSTWIAAPLAEGIAVCIAAAGAGIIHLYQGSRAAIIIVQLSILFGLLFVVSGHDLWCVILCHGLYDTIAFIRFANKTSRYSRIEDTPPRRSSNSG